MEAFNLFCKRSNLFTYLDQINNTFLNPLKIK